MASIAYLESIRGFAALQVLLLHFFAAFAPDLANTLPAGAAIAGAIHTANALFLLFQALNGAIGIELARRGAIVAGICFAFAARTFFLPIDRYALELSRRLCKRMSAGAAQPLRAERAMATE